MSWSNGKRIDEPSAAEMSAYRKQGKVLSEIDELRRTIRALRVSVQPIEGHDDPGSIEDCWNLLEDGLTTIANIV